ncbi:ComEC/Rec2 family competence protein, partial [Candidatus Kaiserbacteria bacterium]|nr:ComEC/Rec2 family competence protein [Candidatus Kaiserbacteria bacterium]
PYLVLYDLSYQLSVISTLGLTLFSNPLAKKILFVPEAWGFREIVSTTVSTQLTVLPLLILSVGQVSVVSLFTNILVLPAVPFAMLASFIASLIALLSQALAFPFSAIAYGLLHHIISVSVWFGNLPFAAIPVSQNATWLTLSILACVYAGVFLFFAIRTKQKAP